AGRLLGVVFLAVMLLLIAMLFNAVLLGVALALRIALGFLLAAFLVDRGHPEVSAAMIAIALLASDVVTAMRGQMRSGRGVRPPHHPRGQVERTVARLLPRGKAASMVARPAWTVETMMEGS